MINSTYHLTWKGHITSGRALVSKISLPLLNFCHTLAVWLGKVTLVSLSIKWDLYYLLYNNYTICFCFFTYETKFTVKYINSMFWQMRIVHTPLVNPWQYPKATTVINVFIHRLVLPVLGCHTNVVNFERSSTCFETYPLKSFCFLSHVVLTISRSFFFIAEHIQSYKYSSLFIHYPINGHLGCFQLLAITVSRWINFSCVNM